MCTDFRQLLITGAFLVSLVLVSLNPVDEAIVRYAKSAEILNYMNVSHDPCENFSDFVCGNYYRINPPNEQPYQTNVFQTISKSLSRKFAKLLKADDAADTEAVTKVKKFYESCMNVGTLKNGYRAKLLEIINEFGQMPALAGDKWRESEFDWVKTVAEIAHKYDIRIIAGYVIQVDVANNTVNRLHITMQDMPLMSASVYTDDVHKTFRDGRKHFMTRKLRNFLGMERELAERTVNQIFEFEINLFSGYKSGVNATDIHTHTHGDGAKGDEQDKEDVFGFVRNITTIEEMQTKYADQLDIKRLLNISLGWVPTDPVYDLIGNDVENIAIVIKKTPKHIVANYIFYYLLLEFMQIIPADQHETHDVCIESTKSFFAKVLDNMVYRSYTTNQTEADVEYMWQTIKTTFHSLLQSDKLSWMKPETRKYAIEKLQSIRMEINSYQLANVNEEFGPLALNSRDYIENVKSILALNGIRSRAKLKEAAKSYDDGKTLSFTPAYILTENLIKVPVSILQPYFLWSDSYPNALKFSTLGFLMAHELIHAFDEEGRTFDKAGNKDDWWDKDSNLYFDNHTQCFNAQYTKYIYGGQPLPELDSQSENIADNGGIRLAYEAYLRWDEDALRAYRNMELESMPRLNYTSKQLFFISYGQMWCSATHPILRKFVATSDRHVPTKFRVIGPLSNLQDFSKEFDCPVDSFMNPKDKCIIY